MSFDKKYYDEAAQEISRRKNANQRIRDERTIKVSQMSKEYRLLRIDLASTTEALPGLIFGGPGAVEKVTALEAENLRISEQIHQLLSDLGVGRNYLDPIYTCAKCHDTGIYENRRCDCFNEIVKRLAAADLNKSSPIQLSSFDTFDLTLYSDEPDKKTGLSPRAIMQHNLEFCKAYAQDFHIPCRSIVMRGKTGLGKTHLSLSIANEVIKKGYSVIYGSAPDLFRRVEQEHFGRGENGSTEELLYSADLLILDDLGAEFESQFYVSALYNIVNSRQNCSLPIIISTNFDRNELMARYNERITSRLFTMETLLFSGNDIRAIKAASGR